MPRGGTHLLFHLHGLHRMFFEEMLDLGGDDTNGLEAFFQALSGFLWFQWYHGVPITIMPTCC